MMSNVCPQNQSISWILLEHLSLVAKFGVIMSGMLRTVTFDQSQKSIPGCPKNQSVLQLHKNQLDGLTDIETDVISLFIVLEVVKDRILQEQCSHLHHCQNWFTKKFCCDHFL